MDATSTVQERQAAAEKRKAAFLGEYDDVLDRARRAQPRLAETRSNSRGVTARRELAASTTDTSRSRRRCGPRLVERDGKNWYKVAGTASTFGRSYDMWDIFGPYEEKVVEGAADATLAAKPDVVFLIEPPGPVHGSHRRPVERQHRNP